MIDSATTPLRPDTALAIEARDVAADYSGHVALHDVHLSLPTGKFIAIIGPNGSGKSTLLKLLTGTKKPSRGHLAVCGMDIRSARRAHAVAYVPQEAAIDWDFPISVWDVVLSGRYGHCHQEGGWRRWLPPRFIGETHRRIATDALRALQIDDLAKRPIGALSGGQKKRVFLARSLAQQPELMLLDEPLAGVDRRSEGIILDQLLAFVARGKSVVMVTHDLPTVQDCADLVVLVSGTIADVGSPQDMLTPASLERGYHFIETRKSE
jgi:manganese/iron transport system ATP-binding protein